MMISNLYSLLWKKDYMSSPLLSNTHYVCCVVFFLLVQSIHWLCCCCLRFLCWIINKWVRKSLPKRVRRGHKLNNNSAPLFSLLVFFSIWCCLPRVQIDARVKIFQFLHTLSPPPPPLCHHYSHLFYLTNSNHKRAARSIQKRGDDQMNDRNSELIASLSLASMIFLLKNRFLGLSTGWNDISSVLHVRSMLDSSSFSLSPHSISTVTWLLSVCVFAFFIIPISS